MSSNGMNSVLVIDDSPHMQQALRAVLTLKGYRALSARTATEGLAVLDQSPPPDLVLLDLMMPGMSGLEFLDVVRRDARFGELPVIVVTASDSHGDEARQLGADDYLVKSRYSNAELLGRIAHHLNAAPAVA